MTGGSQGTPAKHQRVKFKAHSTKWGVTLTDVGGLFTLIQVSFLHIRKMRETRWVFKSPTYVSKMSWDSQDKPAQDSIRQYVTRSNLDKEENKYASRLPPKYTGHIVMVIHTILFLHFFLLSKYAPGAQAKYLPVMLQAVLSSKPALQFCYAAKLQRCFNHYHRVASAYLQHDSQRCRQLGSCLKFKHNEA